MNFFKDKDMLVLSVKETINSLRPGSVLTMTIARWPSGGYSARTATEELSEGTEKKTPTSSSQPMNISPKNTQDG